MPPVTGKLPSRNNSKLTPPLKWHGGKHYLASKIVAMMTDHFHYVEPYAGGLAVLLKKRCEGVSEVVNDLHGGLTNFWKVLQDEEAFEEFRRRIEAVPFSEPEFVKYGNLHELNPEECDVTCALAFFVRCRQSLAGRMDTFAPVSRNRTRGGMNEQVSAWLSAVEGLPAVHARLRRILILNRDALDVIRQHDSPNTLFYCDPPYLHETRTTTGEYDHEMTAEQHGDLLDVLVNAKGKVMLSGYRSNFYDCHLEGWHRTDFDLPNNSASGPKKRRMTECVWSNFKPSGRKIS